MEQNQLFFEVVNEDLSGKGFGHEYYDLLHLKQKHNQKVILYLFKCKGKFKNYPFKFE